MYHKYINWRDLFPERRVNYLVGQLLLTACQSVSSLKENPAAGEVSEVGEIEVSEC